jgi:hypothetical protein
VAGRRIFISYRRGESTIYAGRLYDGLSARVGEDDVFMDVDALEPGVDFVEHIEREVGSCQILIALIGRDWVDVTDAEGNRRLEDPQDFVRLELATGLGRDIRVIPVLVQGARMPRAEQLPDDLKPLARRNALEIADLRWRHDFARLWEVVEKVLEGASVPRAIELSGVRNFVPPPEPEATVAEPLPEPEPAPDPSAACPLVFVQEQPDAGREVPVADGMTIGRTSGDVLIPDPQVSRRHAVVRLNGPHPVLEDLGSTNGTFVNGEQLTAPRELQLGDEVRFGTVAWRLQPAR